MMVPLVFDSFRFRLLLELIMYDFIQASKTKTFRFSISKLDLARLSKFATVTAIVF